MAVAAWGVGLAFLLILVFLAAFTVPLLLDGEFGELWAWTWRPDRGEYGILPMVVGSLVLAILALLVAFPLALGACLFVHGLGPTWLARPLFALLNFMTGIPTIVYAFVSVLFLVPLVRGWSDGSGYSLLAAAWTLGVLILPTVALLIDTGFHAAAPGLRRTGAALGLRRSQQLVYVVLPASKRALLAALVLGFGRAIGDTMIALLVAGNAPQLPDSLFASMRALTAHIALVFEVDTQSSLYRSIFASGLILLLVTAAVHVVARRLAMPRRGASHAR